MYTEIDLSLSPEGDFVLDESGDLAVSIGDNFLREEIAVRILTQQYDWYHYPLLGANLEELLGEKNLSRIAQAGEIQIEKSLTYDGLLSSSELKILSFPIGGSILYKVYARSVDPNNSIDFIFDINKGVIENVDL